MPSIRIGYSTEFVLRNELVGIGSTATSSRLDVAGQIRSENTAGSGGVSTFREYQGFSQVQAKITNTTLIDNGSSGPYSSLAGEIKITGETTVSSGSTVEVGKTKTLTVTDRFAVPLGETNNRDNAPEAGTTRFNQDFGTLEFFDGVSWKTVNSYNRGGAAGRVVLAGGRTPGVSQIMEYVNIMTLGNTQDFGTLSGTARRQSGGLANSIRGLNAGGQGPSANINDIDYFTMASGGNTVDFGNLTGGAKQTPAGASSSTRGLFMGGGESGDTPVDDIDYCEIMTTGDTIDFGNLSVATRANNAYSSPTRAVKCGGQTPSTQISILDYVTISSKGNAIEYGDLTQIRRDPGTCANSVRGLIAGGSGGGNFHKSIDVSTIATGGNCTDFGDCTTVGNSLAVGSAGNSTRGLFIFGTNPDSNVINYVTLATSGDAIDFGDVSGTLGQQGCCSDSHGGLGGF